MKGLFAALAAVSFASAAFGGLYTYHTTNPAADGISVSTTGGTVSNLTTTFDTTSKVFTWNVTFSDGAAKNTGGFWLVVGPGPNPKGTAGEYAIMYFDASSLASPNVSIYDYNGNNGDDSFTNPGIKILSTKTSGQSQITGVSATQSAGARTFSFSVNATFINALPMFGADWKGIQFGPQVGIWMHPVTNLTTAYSGDALTSFSYYTEGYYDGQNNNTTPAPAAASLLALGSLIAARRKRN